MLHRVSPDFIQIPLRTRRKDVTADHVMLG
jgi:hypothetical protein